MHKYHKFLFEVFVFRPNVHTALIALIGRAKYVSKTKILKFLIYFDLK